MAYRMTKENKEQLLANITQAAKTHLITRNELLKAYNKGHSQAIYGSHSSKNLFSLSLTEVFSSIGGGIIFLGIAILISEHWNAYSSFNKIALTFGSGVIVYVMGI